MIYLEGRYKAPWGLCLSIFNIQRPRWICTIRIRMSCYLIFAGIISQSLLHACLICFSNVQVPNHDSVDIAAIASSTSRHSPSHATGLSSNQMRLTHCYTIDSLDLNSLEKVHIRKLAHLINIMGFNDLLIVEENPSWNISISQSLADESNVMSSMDTCALVAHD